MPEWLKGTDCKSVGASLRWFESTPAHHFKEDESLLFLCRGLDENHNKAKPCLVRARSEQSAKDFSLEETKFLKRKSVDTFNASDARQSTPAQIKKKAVYLLSFFISRWQDENHSFGGSADFRTY